MEYVKDVSDRSKTHEPVPVGYISLSDTDGSIVYIQRKKINGYNQPTIRRYLFKFERADLYWGTDWSLDLVDAAWDMLTWMTNNGFKWRTL